MMLLVIHPSPFILYLFPLSDKPLIVLMIIAVIAGLAAAVIAVSRHKKSSTAKIQLIGAEALVYSQLAPEGSVLIEGELWRARSLDGTRIETQVRVEVADVAGHLVLVKRYV